jgi:poly(3-hydroxybutyrate) depolymerase
MIGQMSGSTANGSPVYVTGLSAGGAMACAMLAAYPEIFAGGSIIAGLPYGSATDVPSAFAAMHRPKSMPANALGERVRNASHHSGPWPRINIWQGADDKTVVPQNADELSKQWLDVHDVKAKAGQASGPRTDWRNAAGKIVVSRYVVEGMAHGAPINSRGIDACGSAAPYVIDAGVSSSLIMAREWGLANATLDEEGLAPEKLQVIPLHKVSLSAPVQEPARSGAEQRNNQRNTFIQNTIQAALKSAGLIRS